ncbi:TetR/AcrR family transcriptional regulator [Kutzneria viridogrisea]|uniref:TetR family transcription regulator n=2 Tax=Kutzneria TaxID=43356 RepID=W5W824_9PSEU|nr:TetR/AcrR family transcriptional regulator [Kutzneria albida]AHH94374.1 TetR family transcription regulator [Kutzneria albida DSM 43870]MBA8930040.1 AcrR family transcriptional regulator [Kutzneria viridogrisea]
MGRAVKGSREGGDARRERWRAHREARREEFVDATIRALTKHGPEVGMDEIAAEAGVTKPVLYRHFADKSDLYLAVGHRGTEMLLERMRPALVDDGTPYERIHRAVDAYLSTIEEHPALYHFVVRRSFADKPVEQDVVSQDKQLIANTLARLLGDYLRAFELDSGGAEPWAYAVVGMVQSAGDWWLERQSMTRQSLTEYLTKIIWFAIEGLLRSGGIAIDPDLPLSLGPALRLVPDPESPASAG